MNNILNQLVSPVLLHGVFVFFLFASIFALIIGVGLASRSTTALRFIAIMNHWVSLRKMMKPLMTPHLVEPVRLRRPIILGLFIALGATISVLYLKDIEARYFETVFLASSSPGSALGLANAIKWLLLFGNGLCIPVGLLMLFSPRLLSTTEAYADRWYSLRKQTYPLDKMHHEVDNWTMAHPTVSGIILIIMSLGLGISMYGQI